MHSERIKEFLKYASPRLDYIEHCMEKQALSPAKIVGYLEKLRQSGRLSQAGKFKATKKFLNDYKNYIDEDSSRHIIELAASHRNKVLNYNKAIKDRNAAAMNWYNSYGTMPDDSLFPPLPNKPVFGAKDPKPAAAPKPTPTADPKPAPKGDKPDADNAKGWWDDFSKGVGTWAKEHPVLTPAITAGVAAPITGGIGYGIGRDSGFESGSSNAAAYWQMREALRNHQLRGVNSEFLTRLANLFGGGDLSRLIG